MDRLVVVFAKLVLLFGGPATQRLLQIAIGVLAADHEADLARGIGGDGGVCVFDGWEYFFAVCL